MKMTVKLQLRLLVSGILLLVPGVTSFKLQPLHRATPSPSLKSTPGTTVTCVNSNVWTFPGGLLSTCQVHDASNSNNHTPQYLSSSLLLHPQLQQQTCNNTTTILIQHTPSEKSDQNDDIWLMVDWLLLMSGWTIYNFFNPSKNVWPNILQTLIPPRLRVWSLCHQLGAMIFSGGIATTTTLEYYILQQLRQREEPAFIPVASLPSFFKALFQAGTWLIIPSLSLALISGVVLSFERYGTLRYVPTHISATGYILLIFGLWWGIADVTSQSTLLQHFDQMMEPQHAINLDLQTNKMTLAKSNKSNIALATIEQYEKLISILELRLLCTLVSCGFCVLLYAVMILKPGRLLLWSWKR